MMSGGWKKVPLDDVMRLDIDAVPVDQLPEFPMAGVYSFARGLFAREALPSTKTTYKFFHRLHKDMFVISTPKAWEGALARVTDEFCGWFLSPVFPTFRADLEKLDIKYLELFCRQAHVWSELQRKSRGLGARREAVSAQQFLSLEIPLPPLEEQRRIVARISALAERIAAVQSLRCEISKEIDAFVSSYHFDYSSNKIRIKDILYLDEEKEVVSVDGIYPQVGVRSFGKGLFTREILDGTQTTYKWFHRLYDGAVVLSQVKGWEGAIGVCDSSLAGKFVSPEYRTFRCIADQAMPEYLAALVPTSYFCSKLKEITRGVGARRERVRPELFLELEIPMPDIVRQKKAVEIFSRLTALRAAQAGIERELTALTPSIIDHAFRGELSAM